MGWIRHTQDTALPLWLRENLDSECVCGSEYENYYNDRGECTNRRCSNPCCSLTIAERIADMCIMLKVPGIREGKGLQMVKDYRLTSHFQAIPYIFKEKPEITLAQLLRISFIYGVDTRWDDICSEYETVEDLLANYKGRYRALLKENEKIIKEGASYVVVKRGHRFGNNALITGNVMITGNIDGYENRDDFINGLAAVTDGIIRLKVVGKRKTGVMCLITKKDSERTGKYEAAVDSGIPILTPEEFTSWIAEKLRNKLKEMKK